MSIFWILIPVIVLCYFLMKKKGGNCCGGQHQKDIGTDRTDQKVDDKKSGCH